MKTLLYYNAVIVYGRSVMLPRVTISGKEIPNLEIILHSYSDNTATVGAAITTADTYIGGWVRFFCIGTMWKISNDVIIQWLGGGTSNTRIFPVAFKMNYACTAICTLFSSAGYFGACAWENKTLTSIDIVCFTQGFVHTVNIMAILVGY